MYEGLSDLEQFPSALHRQEPYFPLYSTIINSIAALTAPVLCFTFFIIFKSKSGLLPTYKRLLLATLFWCALSLIAFIGISKLVIVAPCTVVINIGFSSTFGTTGTVVFYAIGCFSLLSTVQSVYNSFVFNYLLVSLLERKVSRSATPTFTLTWSPFVPSSS